MKGFATRLLACLRRLCESPADLGSPAADGEVVQLAESSELTTSFLLEPLAWRVRVVEHILVDSAHNCERRRSVQCAPLRQFLADRGFPVGAGARSAMVVVNVASVPRGPLMNFDVEGPLGSAYPAAATRDRRTSSGVPPEARNGRVAGGHRRVLRTLARHGRPAAGRCACGVQEPAGSAWSATYAEALE